MSLGEKRKPKGHAYVFKDIRIFIFAKQLESEATPEV